jgi:hypothetical protein
MTLITDTEMEDRIDRPPANGHTPNVDTLLYFVRTREEIRIKKERGDSWPWTDDPTLRDGVFCNIQREHDRTTRWWASNWRQPHAEDPHLWFASLVRVLVNRPATLEAIGYDHIVPWDPDKFRTVWDERDEAFFGDAYTITVGKGYANKVDFLVAEIFNPMWRDREAIRPRPGDTLAGFARRLCKFKFIDHFYAGQICADLKYVAPLDAAADWASFILSGPGSRKGLNLVLGRPVKSPWTESEWRACFNALFDEIAPDLAALGLGDLHNQDKQNILCEGAKFFQARSGKGGRLRPYHPNRAQAAAPRISKTRLRPVPNGNGASQSPVAPPHADSAAPAPRVQLVEGATIMPEREENVVPLKIVKPSFLEPFKSKRAPTIAGVETLLTALPIMRPADANDFIRIHHSEDDYWSPELCFVSVPIHGDKRDQLHLIEEDIAMLHLSAKKVKRFRLALATKPYDAMFFCIVPTQNLDNAWNDTALAAIEKAKTHWVQVSSRKAEGVEGYKTDLAKDADAFPLPKWTTRSLEELLKVSFNGAIVDSEEHPALRRLIGAKQDLS